jgi:hypothetical protein
MHRRLPPRALLRLFAGCLAAAAAVAVAAPAEPPTATATFVDGTEVRGAVTDLGDPAQAAIDKRRLFGPESPVRVLATGVPRLPPPPAFIEFDNGDRLPGRVVAHRPERFEWQDLPLISEPANHPRSYPATLAVEGGDGTAWPSGWPWPAGTHLPAPLVRRDRVRRIAWQAVVGRPYAPRTIFLADGGVIPFRSLRWNDDAVVALREDGSTQRHEFAAIAELHLAPRPDPWNAWFESLDDVSGLATIETQSGFRATAPLSRWHPRDKWIMVQPSWSLMPLFPALAGVTRIFPLQAAEPPLECVEPTRVAQRSALGQSWAWRRNRNVQGGPLEPHGPPAAWGLGVQARTELSFPLCVGTQGFRGRVGLDRVVAAGGCFQASIHAGAATAPALWQSGVLVGSGTIADCGTVPLGGPEAGQQELVLVADDAHADRPPGADAHDIRDVVDWVDPRLVLDPAAASRQAAARLPFVIPAWSGWTQTAGPETSVRLVRAFDPVLRNGDAGWAAATVAEGGPLRLTREWPALRPNDENLLIAAAAVGGDKPVIEVRVDGSRWELPLVPQPSGQPAIPFVLPLAGRPAGPLAVEIVVPAKTVVQWQALGLTGPLDSDWFPLQPLAIESSSKSQFTIREDGSVLTTTPPPAADAYTIRLRSPGRDIRAVRIDALTDPALPKPHHGPGRTSAGYFMMSKLVLEAGGEGGSQPLEAIAMGVRPLQYVGNGTFQALVATTGWTSTPAKPNLAAFRLPGAGPAPRELLVRMEFSLPRGKQLSLGCFRVLASEDPAARLPLPAATYLVTKPDAAGSPPRQTIVATGVAAGAGR